MVLRSVESVERAEHVDGHEGVTYLPSEGNSNRSMVPPIALRAANGEPGMGEAAGTTTGSDEVEEDPRRSYPTALHPSAAGYVQPPRD